MPFNVRYVEEAGVVEMVLRGAVTPEDVDAAMTEAGTVGAENLSNRFLVDSREMPAGGSAFDVLALAELLSDDAAAADQMEFFETACRNRGLDVRVFRDRDEALGWLTA